MEDKFCGWYFRCRSDSQTIAFIPALHTAEGRRSGSLQIISDAGSRMILFSAEDVRVDRRRPRAALGHNVFCERGILLSESREDISIHGNLRFGKFSRIGYDVMGPFRYVPFMECRHSVVSMRHTVSGSVWIDGAKYCFQNGLGYLEGDRGRSFPRRYAWTQCFFKNGSLMLSVADVPMGGFTFTGIIGVIQLGGKEYRLATYLGARAEKTRGGEIIIRQGEMIFYAALTEKNAYTLKAPKIGDMTRSIHESVTCRAEYRFVIGERTLLDLTTEEAAFEYEYPT